MQNYLIFEERIRFEIVLSDFGDEPRNMNTVITVAHHQFERFGGGALLSGRLFGNHDLDLSRLVIFRVVEEQIHVSLIRML